MSPTQPPTGIDYFTGRWTSPFSTTITMNGTPGGCSNFDYTFAKVDANSATVSYDVVCASYTVKGTGSAVLQDSTLKWNASGTVTAANIACPFAFTDSTAAPQGNDRIPVTYNVTVCGLGPFKGSQTLKRK